MLSDVLKGLLKTVYFPNSVKHYLNALICSAICFSMRNLLQRRDHFQPLWTNPILVEALSTRALAIFGMNCRAVGLPQPKGRLPGPGQEGIFTYFRAGSLTQPSAHPQTQECAPQFPGLQGWAWGVKRAPANLAKPR